MGLNIPSVRSSFWRGKRVFLTGHTGFKGSWLSLWLQSLGVEVYGLSLISPTFPSLFEEANVGEKMISMIGDICNYSTVLDAMKSCQPDVVFHLAAQPLVRYSYLNPVQTFATNVMGTVHVLEAAREVGTAKAIVNVTTDKCYENKEWEWGYRENEALGGSDPYSNSKACSELITTAYRQSYFLQTGSALATARSGNVIGGGDWAADRLLPDILRAFEQKSSVIIRHPKAIRPWQHVLEALSGYLMLAERLYVDGNVFSGGWNFGPHDNDARPVQWIVERMIKNWKHPINWYVEQGVQPYEHSCLRLDISKAKSLLGWCPRWDLSVALAHVCSWHEQWMNGGNMRNVCLQQIEEFQSM